MTRVAIFNYGVGNLYSLRAALSREGVKTYLTASVGSASKADALLLPGVGNFSEAAKRLPRRDILNLVRSGKPLIGICLGLQLLLERSEEGLGEGLGIFPGVVKRLPNTVKVPQMGWNTIKIRRSGGILEGVSEGSWVYYVHSYYPATQGPWVIATSEYGVRYPALISQNNVFCAQFHPEKSGRTGRIILRNFLRMLRK